MAAEEQALRTRWSELQVQKEKLTPRCKLSESENETFCHLLAGCSMLSNGPNKRRYDRMSLRVYLELC